MNTILTFLRQLETNNNKAWFDAHKTEYQEARAHFNAIVEQLIDDISAFDPSVKGVGIKECTYRINLDIDEVLKIFKSAKPFLDYVNRAIEYSRE